MNWKKDTLNKQGESHKKNLAVSLFLKLCFMLYVYLYQEHTWFILHSCLQRPKINKAGRQWLISLYFVINWTGYAKINFMSPKNCHVLFLLYHHLLTNYMNATKCLPILQNLMGFLLQFTETEYCIQNWRY